MATNKPVEVDSLFGEIAYHGDKSWIVVYTKPQREKKLAAYSKKNNIHYYLPLKDSVRVYNKRKVQFTKPVFPGYIFIEIAKADKSILVRSGHIVTFLDVKNQAELIYDLNNLYLGIEQAEAVEEATFFENGTKVQIITGSMKGLTGIIQDQNPNHLIVNIHFLKQAVSINVNRSDIKVIE